MKRPLLFSLMVLLSFVLYLLLLQYSPGLISAEMGNSLKQDQEECSILVTVQPLWCGLEGDAPFEHGTYLEMADGTALFPNNPYEIRQSRFKIGQRVEIAYDVIKEGVVPLACTPKTGQAILPVTVKCIKEVKERKIVLNQESNVYSIRD